MTSAGANAGMSGGYPNHASSSAAATTSSPATNGSATAGSPAPAPALNTTTVTAVSFDEAIAKLEARLAAAVAPVLDLLSVPPSETPLVLHEHEVKRALNQYAAVGGPAAPLFAGYLSEPNTLLLQWVVNPKESAAQLPLGTPPVRAFQVMMDSGVPHQPRRHCHHHHHHHHHQHHGRQCWWCCCSAQASGHPDRCRLDRPQKLGKTIPASSTATGHRPSQSGGGGHRQSVSSIAALTGPPPALTYATLSDPLRQSGWWTGERCDR